MTATATELPAAAEQLSINELVDAELTRADEPDYDAIASAVIERVDDDQYAQLALYGARAKVAERAVQHRLRATRPGKTKRGGQTRSARHEAASKATQRRPEMFRQAIHVGHHDDGRAYQKWLGDCNAADLHAAAAIQRAQGDAHQATAYVTAGRYEKLARKLRGGALVKSLSVRVVQAVFASD